MQGIIQGPQFRRIKIETVGLSLVAKFIAAFERPRIVLTEDYIVRMPDGNDILLPVGFESDGGSIPIFILWALAVIGAYMGGWWCVFAMVVLLLGIILNPFGLMLIAFLVHDYALKHKCVLLNNGGSQKIPSVQAANGLMRRVNFMVNDMIILGLIAHAAVTVGAWYAWGNYRRQERAA